jgi:hypothetical protein
MASVKNIAISDDSILLENYYVKLNTICTIVDSKSLEAVRVFLDDNQNFSQNCIQTKWTKDQYFIRIMNQKNRIISEKIFLSTSLESIPYFEKLRLVLEENKCSKNFIIQLSSIIDNLKKIEAEHINKLQHMK